MSRWEKFREIGSFVVQLFLLALFIWFIVHSR